MPWLCVGAWMNSHWLIAASVRNPWYVDNPAVFATRGGPLDHLPSGETAAHLEFPGDSPYLGSGRSPTEASASRTEPGRRTSALRRLSPTSAAIISIVIALSIGVRAIADEPDGLGVRDREELLGYARDTWKSVAAMGDGSELPVNGLRHLVNGTWKPSLKTSPTDIASYLWSVRAAERLKIIGADDAHRRLERTLGAMGA